MVGNMGGWFDQEWNNEWTEGMCEWLDGGMCGEWMNGLVDGWMDPKARWSGKVSRFP